MNAHFASRNLFPNGTWRAQTKMYNVASDISPTAAQMPRSVGLAYASVMYRKLQELHESHRFLGQWRRDRLRHHRQRIFL
ncbi:hypothetical protein [Candidatus Villigracilis saccharophilus]|uniref:hypothetical protein n=1 Tax=Candidatus Villigracilis saccharophilus TaxID=3140684 RepID=UPI0031EC697F